MTIDYGALVNNDSKVKEKINDELGTMTKFMQSNSSKFGTSYKNVNSTNWNKITSVSTNSMKFALNKHHFRLSARVKKIRPKVLDTTRRPGGLKWFRGSQAV